jgi:hypothetical protein
VFGEFYAQSPLLFWPLVGLVIFVVSFAAVLLYVVYGLREPGKVQYLAALPLEDDANFCFDERVTDGDERDKRNER